jgi:hypothetical protein
MVYQLPTWFIGRAAAFLCSHAKRTDFKTAHLTAVTGSYSPKFFSGYPLIGHYTRLFSSLIKTNTFSHKQGVLAGPG